MTKVHQTKDEVYLYKTLFICGFKISFFSVGFKSKILISFYEAPCVQYTIYIQILRSISTCALNSNLSPSLRLRCHTKNTDIENYFEAKAKLWTKFYFKTRLQKLLIKMQAWNTFCW